MSQSHSHCRCCTTEASSSPNRCWAAAWANGKCADVQAPQASLAHHAIMCSLGRLEVGNPGPPTSLAHHAIMRSSVDDPGADTPGRRRAHLQLHPMDPQNPTARCSPPSQPPEKNNLVRKDPVFLGGAPPSTRYGQYRVSAIRRRL